MELAGAPKREVPRRIGSRTRPDLADHARTSNGARRLLLWCRALRSLRITGRRRELATERRLAQSRAPAEVATRRWRTLPAHDRSRSHEHQADARRDVDGRRLPFRR